MKNIQLGPIRWLLDDEALSRITNPFRKIDLDPFKKLSVIKSMLKKLCMRRKDQCNALSNMKAERDAQQMLSAEVQLQRVCLNELDGFPTTALDSEGHSHRR